MRAPHVHARTLPSGGASLCRTQHQTESCSRTRRRQQAIVAQSSQSRFDVALSADRTAVCGVSASGEFALAMGFRHPDIYGTVYCASPGAGYRPPAVMPASLPRAYLVAGTQEPFFLENAARWADALRDAGADVVMTERVGSHGDPFWRDEFPLMVAWAFGG